MVTLVVENFFSLMRKDDPMPMQLEYRTLHVWENSRSACTGVTSIITRAQKAISLIRLSTADIQLTLEDKRQLCEFSSTFGASVRQHTVRDKSKEETGCLPYAVSLNLQRREPGPTVPHTSFLGESASSEATDNPLTVQLSSNCDSWCSCCEACKRVGTVQLFCLPWWRRIY